MTGRRQLDPIVVHLQRKKMPVTLESWLKLAFAGDPPPNWPEETAVPLELQEELEEYLATSLSSQPPQQHANHLEDAPLPDGGILSSMAEAEAARRVRRVAQMLSSKNQPSNPKPALSKGSLQSLQQFAADAQSKGPSEARSEQVPIPDWQTNRTGIPVSNPSQGKTLDAQTAKPKGQGE